MGTSNGRSAEEVRRDIATDRRTDVPAHDDIVASATRDEQRGSCERGDGCRRPCEHEVASSRHPEEAIS